MRKKNVVRAVALVLCLVFLLLSVGCSGTHGAEAENANEVTRLYLFGDMEGMEDKKDVRSVFAYFNQDGKHQFSRAAIKIQGSSSRFYDKKNYTIKFYKDAEHEEARRFDLGWGEQNEYCLKANWIDKTHSRNIVTAKLAEEIQSKYGIMEQAPRNGLIDGFPIEVYINGSFHGIYTWNIPKAAWLFGMDEENPDHIVMCGENWDPAALFYDLPNMEAWSVEAGPETDETMAKFARLSDFIMNSSDEDFRNNLGQYLNLDSLLNYYVVADFAYLPDNHGKNMLIVTYDGEVWYPSLYDLDTSWGTSWDGLEIYDYENEPVEFGKRNNLARRLEELFPQEIHDRYFELREDILTKEHVMELFYGFDAQIPAEWKEKEVAEWGKSIPGAGFEQIEEYLDFAIPMLDQKYSVLNQK